MNKSRKITLISIVVALLAAIPAFAVFTEKNLRHTLEVLVFELKDAYNELAETHESESRKEVAQHRELIKLIEN